MGREKLGRRSYADITAPRREAVDLVLSRTRPGPGQKGVLAAVGGGWSLDLFDRPETLAAAWRQLVGSYALESLVEVDGLRRVGVRAAT